MNFIKDKYINMSIRKKLTYIYLPLTLIPLLIFAIIAYNTHQTTIIERSLIAAEENNWLLVSQVEDILEDAENCANMLAININNTIEKYERTQSEPKISLFNAINNELSYAMIIFSDISSIAYVDITETVHYTHPNLISNIDKVNEEDYRTILEGSNGINTWFQLTQRDYLVIEQEEGVLTLGKKIIDIHDGKTLGYLYINIKDKTLKDVFNKQQSSSFFIFENGEALLATDDNHRIPVPVEESFYAYESRDSKVYNTDNEKMVVTTLPFKSLDWQLVSVTPLLDLTKDLSEFKNIILLLTASIVMIQLLNSRLLSHVITNPLKELTKSAKKIGEGQFDLKVKQDRYDEIGILSKAFNKMTYKIDELIKDVKSEQKKKREYEMALIQEQIKPHFLYNCLDVIYTLCELERVNEASEATKALADYYRVTLSNGKDIITLGEEFKNVEDYLALQAIRYSDVFTYTIHVDEKIKSYRIVKLTLQPLVENAIYHGLKPRGRQGQIWIHGSIVGQEIYIEVTDNGVGMSEDRVQELMGNRNDTNFGLYNVQDRIGLFFGQGYGLEILSQENEGTTVKIRLPMEEIHHD